MELLLESKIALRVDAKDAKIEWMVK